jgi:hypothetical protein
MRKADYAALAEIIKNYRDAARINIEQLTATDEAHARDLNHRASYIAGAIAYDFALRANVDKAAFLRACGIETEECCLVTYAGQFGATIARTFPNRAQAEQWARQAGVFSRATFI